MMGENDHLLTCPYCRVHLYLSFESYPRYYLPPRDDQGFLFFVPYWRSKGFEFSANAHGIEESVIDRTWNASRFSCFPSSLGVRPQTQTLRFVDQRKKNHFLPVSILPDEPLPGQSLSSLVGRGFPEEEEPILFRSFLKDAFSLIYLPVVEKEGVVYDGIDSKPFGNVPPELLESGHFDSSASDFGCRFVPALCPNCGNDLAGEKESLVVFCQTCMVGFSILNGTLTDIPFLMAEGGSKTATLLPFWRIRVETEGLPLPRMTGRILPGGLMEQFDMDNFFFWVPAFRINPQLFLRLARRATTAQLDAEPLPRLSGASSIPPITVASAEAIKSLKLLLILLSPRDRELLLSLNNLPIAVKDVVPTLVPFEQTGYELTNRQIQAAVHVNALRYGRNL
jgi:uncharacterized protein YbaR (Trm112 family)